MSVANFGFPFFEKLLEYGMAFILGFDDESQFPGSNGTEKQLAGGGISVPISCPCFKSCSLPEHFKPGST